MAARTSGRLGKWLVSGPPLLYLTFFFAIPTLIMVLASFRTPGEFGGLAPFSDEAGQVDLNVESYARFFTEPVYAEVFLKSVGYALVTTFACLVLAYPVLFVYQNLRTLPLQLKPNTTNLVVLSYLLILLTTSVLYLLACDPLPPCAGKVREWMRGLSSSRVTLPESE